MKKDLESTVTGGMFSVQANMLKGRRVFSECLWQGDAGGEQREVRTLRQALRLGRWARWMGTPASSSVSSLPPQDPARSAGFHPSGSVLAVGTVTGR